MPKTQHVEINPREANKLLCKLHATQGALYSVITVCRNRDRFDKRGEATEQIIDNLLELGALSSSLLLDHLEGLETLLGVSCDFSKLSKRDRREVKRLEVSHG